MNDIRETSNGLICETSLTDTINLSFKWYKNDVGLTSNDELEIVMHKQDLLSSEIIFKKKNKNGVYTCSLIFAVEKYQKVKNKTILINKRCKL